MAWVTLRCPRCGAYVAAPAYPTMAPTWATCPHCSTPLPVVSPRDPAPLFTWEAFPGLYPALRAPQAPNPRVTPATAIVLLGLAIVLAGLAGGLAATGVAALGPATYEVGGTVEGLPPTMVATVHVTGEAGFNQSVTTGPQGRFLVPGVPAGGVLLNITTPRSQAALVSLFLSPVYSSIPDPTNFTVLLAPGSPENATVQGSAVYGDMEGMLTGVWSGSAVLAIASGLAGIAAVAAWRRRGPTWVVAGGTAAAVVPFALVELGIASAFPLVEIPLFVLVAAGVTALTLGLVDFAWAVPMETER